ncbi:MAG: NAD(P)H-dependent glycerol-3-phosphate dehydrogenase [bacterium]
MKVSVIGAGGWGTTLAVLLNENGHEVTLWEFFKEYAEEMQKTRENTKFLKGIKIPETISITNDMKKAVETSQVLVMAVPSHVMRSALGSIKKFNYKNKIIVSVTKGIEQETLMRMSQVVQKVLGKVKFCALTGPSHAEEVSRKVPTVVVAASKDRKTAQIIQHLFTADYFRVYTHKDLLGAELGGSIKNVIAIAAGVIDGLGAGDNTKAALMTRGLAEMTRLGVRMGAKRETFAGLAGMGDLIVTCASQHSRNRAVGELLGKGKKIAEILNSMEMVAEGVKTTLSAYKLSKKYKVEMPITEEIYNILYNDKSAKDSIKSLMTRSPKSEQEFLQKKG